MQPITFAWMPETPLTLHVLLGGERLTAEQTQALVNLLNHNPGVQQALAEAQSFEPLLNQ